MAKWWGGFQTAARDGEIGGITRAFNIAQERGFEGNLSDFFATMKEVSTGKEFTGAQAMQHFADKYFGGNMQEMFRSMHDYQQGRVVGALNEIREQGFTPENIGIAMGEIDALGDIGHMKGVNQVGGEAYMSAQTDEVLKQVAGFNMLRKAAKSTRFDADKDGQINKDEMYNFLQHHKGAGIQVVLNDKQGRALGHDGGGVFDVSIGSDGEIAFVRSEKGNVDRNLDTKETDTRTIDLSGSIRTNYDVVDSVVKRGPGFGEDAVFWSTRSEDLSIAGRVSGLIAEGRTREADAERLLQDKNLTNSLNKMQTKQGTKQSLIQSTFDAKIAAGLEKPKIFRMFTGMKADAGVEIDAGMIFRNMQEQKRNLHLGNLQRINQDATEKATIDNEFDSEKHSRLLTDGRNQYIDEVKKFTTEVSGLSYGASSAVGGPFERIFPADKGPMMEQIKTKFEGITDRIIGGDKNDPDSFTDPKKFIPDKNDPDSFTNPNNDDPLFNPDLR